MAFFLPAPGGQRFCIHHSPVGQARAAVLHVHPWAEEMNKSRRMAAMACRRLAGDGFAVLQLDLQGCGDSSSDFASASWAGWIDDLLLGVDWLRQTHGAVPLWIWGHRAGALLAVQVAARLPVAPRLLFWQPTTSGKQVLQQFLRLKAAANLQQGDAKSALQQARSDLGAGCLVDIAGYTLAPALALGLEQAMLEPPEETTQVLWLEVSTRTPPALLPASVAAVERWRGAGHEVDASAVTGPTFWQTQEIEDAPALLDATAVALGRVRERAMA